VLRTNAKQSLSPAQPAKHGGYAEPTDEQGVRPHRWKPSWKENPIHARNDLSCDVNGQFGDLIQQLQKVYFYRELWRRLPGRQREGIGCGTQPRERAECQGEASNNATDALKSADDPLLAPGCHPVTINKSTRDTACSAIVLRIAFAVDLFYREQPAALGDVNAHEFVGESCQALTHDEAVALWSSKSWPVLPACTRLQSDSAAQRAMREAIPQATDYDCHSQAVRRDTAETLRILSRSVQA
jgi:hypothetical protein